jgi:hypothetical protein
MALTTVNITGTFNFPDATWAQYTKAEFHISGYDTDTEVVVPKVINSTLSTSGELDVDLWGNDDGIRGTIYSVYVVVYDSDSYAREVIRRDLGKIQVVGDGPLDIADLLDIPAPVPGNFYTLLTEDEYNVALASEADARAAADTALQEDIDDEITAREIAVTNLRAETPASYPGVFHYQSDVQVSGGVTDFDGQLIIGADDDGMAMLGKAGHFPGSRS